MITFHHAGRNAGKGDAFFSFLRPCSRSNGLRGSAFFSRRITLAAILSVLFTLLPLSAESSENIAAARGQASWYGTTANGRQTANGEIYNIYALTAAHKGLPFGTVVRVHNLRNGKQVLVRVNDRGPFVDDRIVDVSKRAAEGLRMTSSGVVPVALEIVGNQKGEPLNKDNGFYIHVANEPSLLKSWRVAGNLEKKVNKPVRSLYSSHGGSTAYALCLGPYKTFVQAQKDFLALEQKQVRALGIIEAPAKGGDIPRYPPPQSGATAGRQKRNGGNPSAASARDCPASSPGFVWEIASSLAMAKSFLLLSAVKNIVLHLTNDPELFRLPSVPVSG